MKNIETLITLGAGYLWDKSSGTVDNKVLGMVNLESRLYSSKNGYLGISFNAYALHRTRQHRTTKSFHR